MGGMHIPNLKPGPFPGQTARTQGAQPSFVSNFRKRIGLIHELRELAGPEKFLDHGRHRLGIDQIMGHEGFNFLQGHPFLDRPFHTHQADPILVFQQFPDGSNPPVSQMIDIIHRAVGIFQFDQLFDGQQDIFLA